MSAVIFADNDILFKLAEYDLLDHACTVLQTEPSAVRVLPSAKYVLLDMKSKLEKGSPCKYSAAAISRASAFVECALPVTDSVDILWSEDVEHVDPGEAILSAAAVASGEDCLLLTGDKRFLKALSQAQSAKRIYDGLCGRVVCLEETLRVIMVTYGVSCVRKAVGASPDCDKAMSLVFGSRFDVPDGGVWAGVESLLRDVINVVGDGWLKRLDA